MSHKNFVNQIFLLLLKQKNNFLKNIIAKKRLLLILIVFIINLYLMIMFYAYGATNYISTIAFYFFVDQQLNESQS